MLSELKLSTEQKSNKFKLPLWDEYIKTRDYKKIGDFIFNEFDLFENYYNNLNKNVIKKCSSSKNH